MRGISRPGRWDVLVPAVILALGLVELALLRAEAWLPAALLEVAAAGLLVLRRQLPLVVAPAAVLCMIALPATGTELNDVATMIFFIALAIYSLGRYVASHGGAVAVAIVVAITLVDFATGPGIHPTDVVFVLALAIPPYVFGRIARRMAEQSEQLARQQAQLRDQAVREERDRIARDLHDVLAHSLSTMVIQTAAAQDLVRSDPAQAEGLLDSVADTGRSALAETGHLLHLIKGDGDEPGLSPTPGLAGLSRLVEGARRSGLTVEDDLQLPAEPLPGTVDVFAYRVVREALTNATKHGAGRAKLVVAVSPTSLRISCSNPVGTAPVPGAGLGVQGMRERVGLLGGTLTAQNGDGSFRLEVEIPLPVEPRR